MPLILPLKEIENLPKGWKVYKVSEHEGFKMISYRNDNYEIRVGMHSGYSSEFFIITEYKLDEKHSFDFTRNPAFEFFHMGMDRERKYNAEKYTAQQINKKAVALMNEVNEGKYDKWVLKQKIKFYERKDRERYLDEIAKEINHGMYMSSSSPTKESVAHVIELEYKDLSSKEKKYLEYKVLEDKPIASPTYKKGGMYAEGGVLDSLNKKYSFKDLFR